MLNLHRDRKSQGVNGGEMGRSLMTTSRMVTMRSIGYKNVAYQKSYNVVSISCDNSSQTEKDNVSCVPRHNEVKSQSGNIRKRKDRKFTFEIFTEGCKTMHY